MLLPTLLSVILGQPAFPTPLFLSAFPVSESAAVKDGTVEVDARVSGRSFAELTARRVARYVAPGRFVVSLTAYPKPRDRATKAHVACTFLVDCDEAPVKTAMAAAVRELGGKIEMPALTGWVSRYITRKTFGRDFDTASVVAARREGDCTEHAVLLAALARAKKIPARVVTGLVLVEVSGKTQAMGHAWVEWHDGRRWNLADAALSPEELEKFGGVKKIRLSYLPVRVIDREDVGFSAMLIDEADTSDISGVVLPLPKNDIAHAGPRRPPP